MTLTERIEACWMQARVFLEHRDFHGLHDMGVEIAALERAKAELAASPWHEWNVWLASIRAAAEAYVGAPSFNKLAELKKALAMAPTPEKIPCNCPGSICAVKAGWGTLLPKFYCRRAVP